MNTHEAPDTDELLARAGVGNAAIVAQLFSRHRPRLRRMLLSRMDPRMTARVDPSDIIQETLLEAHQRLPTYLDERPIPFYPWLRQIAWNRLLDFHRRHILVQKRTVTREEALDMSISDRSTDNLVRQLAAQVSNPSHSTRRKEMRERVHAALARLPEPLREVLVMRHLERLSVLEIAAIQGVAEGTVKSRHFRALELVRNRLIDWQP